MRDDDNFDNVIPNLVKLGQRALKKTKKSKADKLQEQARETAARNALLEQKVKEAQLKKALKEAGGQPENDYEDEDEEEEDGL